MSEHWVLDYILLLGRAFWTENGSTEETGPTMLQLSQYTVLKKIMPLIDGLHMTSLTAIFDVE